MSAKNRVSAPRLSYLASVHPRLYFCRDAALMRLSGGLDRLVYACPDADEDGDKPKETYGVYLNGVPLVDARIPDCSTCGPFLSKGYGDGLIREEECILISPRKLENIPWGRLSDKYPTERFMDFPPEGQPTLDCVPPPDRIRSLIAEEMKKGRGESQYACH